MKYWAQLLVIFATVTAGSFAAGTSAAPVLQLANQSFDEFINNDVTQVAAHDDHACALRQGTVYCWGYNVAGQLGDGTTTLRSSPVKVTVSAVQPGFTNTAVTLVATGYRHTCAVEHGTLYCWGSNGEGRVGTGSFQPGAVSRPTRVSTSATPGFDNTAVTHVGLGDHSCAVERGVVYCWGDNDDQNGYDSGADPHRRDGRLGVNSLNASNRPVKVTPTASFPNNGDVIMVHATRYNTCALASSRVFCWGRVSISGLGSSTGDGSVLNTSYQSSAAPVTVSAVPGFTNTQVTAMSAGYEFGGCAIELAVLYCWGDNGQGQLGDGSGQASLLPVRVADAGGFVNGTVSAVEAGYGVCASSAGRLYCWGPNGGGNVGDGTFTNRATPAAVTTSAMIDNFTNDSITAFSMRFGVGCAIRHDVVYCWGWNYQSQLGNGSRSVAAPWGSPFPVRVAGGVAAPGRPTVTAGDEQATVSWPAVGGVLEYTVTGSPAGTCTVAAPTTTCTIAGLTNDLSHTFTVTASVSGRSSAASLASLPVTPGVAPMVVAPPPNRSRIVTDAVTGPPTAAPVTLSQRTFAPGVPVVYLATRRDLIDAMVAGPAAGASGGPVFTVGPGGLDATTLAEIRRLQPGRIVIMGGDQALPATLDTSVNSQLGLMPSRIEGPDRYATAAQLSAANHSTRAHVVYIATGEVLVDAVSGGPAAGLERAPVLLVRPDAIPEVTRRELRRLRPDRIVVLGQTDAVSDTVRDALRDFATTVERIGGADRYATAVAVAQQRFPDGADTVYLTTGHDATVANAAVVPVATARRGPVLFTRTNCLITEVRTELARLNPTRIVTLGLAVDDILLLPDC
jgi:putative cell wall-binding protein/alpha-tubulin suppressor-like RCC1 family protein